MPKADRALNDVRVLVTRPRDQAGKLAAMIREAGGEPVLFPTLEIVPIEPAAAELAAAGAASMLVFVSANAVGCGYQWVRARAAPDARFVAIGDATRRALEAAGCPGVLVPESPDGSTEALLQQDFMQDLDDRRVCIVRGHGGRETLKQHLEAQGAQVGYLECYRRRAPQTADPDVLRSALQDHGGQLVVSVTSNAGLENLLALASGAGRDALIAQPLVVIGRRQCDAARQHGWQGPVLVAGAADRCIFQAIVDWRVKRS